MAVGLVVVSLVEVEGSAQAVVAGFSKEVVVRHCKMSKPK